MEKLTDLRKKEQESLKKSLMEKKKELADKSIMAKLGKSEKAFKPKAARREIAQISTILREKELLNVR